MPAPSSNRDRWRSATGLFVGVSVLLFLASLPQNAYRIDKAGDPGAPGFLLLLIGWIGVFGRIPAWLANPALLLAWILIWFRRRRFLALICAVGALALALSFLREKQMDVDEAGNHAKIISHGPGYWLWIASIAAMILGSIWMLIRDWIGFAQVASESPEHTGTLESSG